MRRTLGLLVVTAVTVFGIVALRDATQFEGRQIHGGRTQVEFSVDTRNYRHDPTDAASSLWHACVGVVSWNDATEPVQTRPSTFVGSVSPALGEDSLRRFRGCLEDASVDRVNGHVETVTFVAVP